ncbi:MAG: PAS domain-containing protein [Desulfobacteraceae bacterium]|nr:PAS domain-containing protein [Desulfobacteraceae bacterium]
MDDILIKYHDIGNIFDYFSAGVIILSPDRKVISLNHTAEMIVGRSNSEVVGRYCYKEFSNCLCDGECEFYQIFEDNQNCDDPDGGIRDQSTPSGITRILSPLYGFDKKFLGYMEVFQDHSVLKDLIERVRHDDRQFKIILDNLDIGILTADCGGHVTFFNNQAEMITGFDRGHVLGKSCHAVFGDFGREILALSEKGTDRDKTFSRKGELRTRNGNVIPIRANCMPLKNEEGREVGSLATISDLSLLYQFNSAIMDRYTFYDMVGKDPAMQSIFELASVVAASDATVLIEGPTGTGKDVLAKVIHNAGRRAGKPLVKVNCAALPDNLLESELFGYARGAFTGADRDKPGRFQEADQGTIFLDEIGDLPLQLQAKLLRALEDKEFYPLGARKPVKTDVRIVSATNQGLERLIREKRFREDLFYRLNVMRFELPPLVERKADIPLLVSYILKKLCATRETMAERISEEAMEILLNYDYPGNIRELENIIEHALIICQGSIIERKHLPLSFQRNNPSRRTDDRQDSPDTLYKTESGEESVIRAELKKNRWNRGKTAQALNIDRSTLWRKMRKYRIISQ